MTQFTLKPGKWARAFPGVLRSGDRVAGRYQVIKPVAAGGMGRIYHAKDEAEGRVVALKILSVPTQDRVLNERFDREAKILQSISSPNVVRAFEVGLTEDGQRFLVLEWLEGSDLEVRLKGGPLDMDLAYAVAIGALRGLRAIHREGVVHRDVKPGNIFLSSHDHPPRSIKLLDFGVAKVNDEDLLGPDPSLTITGMILGTPFYMSPEQAQGRDKIDHRADLFSLGAVMYECLCGRRPFEASSAMTLLVRIASEAPRPISDVDPSLPDSLDRFFARALARRPEDRFQSAVEMEEAIESLAGHTVEIPLPFSELTAQDETERLFIQTLPGLSIDGPTETQAAASAATRPSLIEANPLPTLRAFVSDSESPDPRERRLVTVLVADLSGVGTRRRLAWALFQRAVTEQGGEALPVRGGLAVGVFGAQQTFGDEPARALQAGLRTLGLDLRSAEDVSSVRELKVAVGTGTVERGLSSAVRGEAIEAACDLLAFAEAGELIADRATLDQVPLAVETSARGRDAFVVRGAGARSVSLSRRQREQRSAPFLGRDRELDALLEAFAEVCETRSPRGALVVGAPGAGKTRLREELRNQLMRRAPGTNVILGHASHSSRSTPLAVFGDALRRRGAIHGNEEAATLVAKLGRLIPRSIGPVIRDQAMSGLARLVGAPALDQYAPTQPDPVAAIELADQVSSRRARASLIDVIRGYCEDGPVVLFLEDMQWADPSSLDVVQELLAEPSPLPLFVLVLSRDHPPAEVETRLAGFEKLSDFERFDLPLLGRSDVSRLASVLLGTEVDALLLDRLMERTGGNPYFLEETLRLLAGADGREATAPSLRLSQRIEAVPTNVHTLIQSRLDALSTESRELLKRAAVIGPSFWEDALVALGIEHPGHVLDRLVDEDFISLKGSSRFPGVRELAFRSSLLRDVAYSIVPEAERAVFHQHTADWLGRMGETDPLILASHLVPAGEHARASVALLEAARHALAMGDVENANSIAREGLGVARPHDLRTMQSDLLVVLQRGEELLGDYGLALSRVDEISKLPRATELEPWIALRRGELTRLRGNPTRARHFFEEAERIFVDLDRPSELALAEIGLGDTLRDRGDVILACDRYQSAYTRARAQGDLRVLSTALARLGRMAYATSDLGQALRLTTEAEQTFEHFIEDLQSRAETASMLGSTWLMVGDEAKATALLERARQEYAQTPNVLGVRICDSYLAWAMLERGERDRGVEALDRVLAESSAAESKHDHFLAGLYRLRIFLDEACNDEAHELAQALRDQAVRGLVRFVVPLESALGLAKARLGQAEDGLRYTVSALHRLESKQACEDEDPQRIYTQHAETLERAGRPQDAQKYWRRARKTLEEVASRLAESQRAPYRRRPINRRILAQSN